MATCNVETLLRNGRDFQKLSDHDLLITFAQQLRVLVGTNPTVESLLVDGRKFRQASDEDLDIIKNQLLCDLVGGVA